MMFGSPGPSDPSRIQAQVQSAARVFHIIAITYLFILRMFLSSDDSSYRSS